MESKLGWFLIGYGACVLTSVLALVILELIGRVGEAMLP